ncbi:Regulatory protein RecX [Microbacterium esteraromaticum]|uniref:Regulatory protein RecX n=2 Tax=Microbacterium esteraromaticum TaxID=57043 RepID=A0A1R4JL68_9MICO|nr:Regulatory protein RecX [Microbacterium esteraromaticum]
MSGDLMSGDEGLAPIIPIFGGAAARRRPETEPSDDHAPRGPGPRHPALSGAAPRTQRPADDLAAEQAIEQNAEQGDGRSTERNAVVALRPLGHQVEADEAAPEQDAAEIRRRAEHALVRKLRAKALSVSEARAVLRGHDLDRDSIDDVIEDFTSRGYIDDHTLASLLVTAGVERKGQGRVALMRSMAQRGLPRDVIDAALEEVPDDDAERALDYARGKANAMSRLDPETALRRLLGQLARRGYGGPVAMNAARTALREAGGSGRGVRFVDSD